MVTHFYDELEYLLIGHSTYPKCVILYDNTVNFNVDEPNDSLDEIYMALFTPKITGRCTL